MRTPPPLPEPGPGPMLGYQSSVLGADAPLRAQGDYVLARDGVIFPRRCVKCNREDGLKAASKILVWSPPWMYLLLIIPGILIGGIILVVTQRRAAISFFVCRECRFHQLKRLLVAWGLFAGALLAFFGAVALEKWPLAVLGCLLILAAPFYAIFACTLLNAQRIENGVVTVRGTGEEFRKSLDVQ